MAAEEVSRYSVHIGLHLGEKLPLYRGQVIEHLFISSENFGEGLMRALAYQRLISGAFHAKLVVEDDRCYSTNGEQPWAENLVNPKFSECGHVRIFYGSLNLLLKGVLNRSILILTSVIVRSS